MSIGTVVTRGYGSGASIALVVTRGYGSGAVVTPVVQATTAGGGRKYRPRYSRAIAYSQIIRKEHQEVIKESQKLIKRAQDQILVQEKTLDLSEVREKARQAVLLERLVDKAKLTQGKILELKKTTELSDKRLQEQLIRLKAENEAILAILIASETYEV